MEDSLSPTRVILLVEDDFGIARDALADALSGRRVRRRGRSERPGSAGVSKEESAAACDPA